MDYEFKPYVGVGPITFNADRSQVRRLLGEPHRVTRRSTGVRESYASGIAVLYSGGGSFGVVVELGFDARFRGLIYAGCQLFVAPPAEVIRFLLSHDPQPFEGFGFLVFNRLGIALTGFHDSKEDDKAITVYAQGRWDADLPDLQPWASKR